MKKWLSILSAAGLIFYPFATYAEDYGSQTSQTQQAPPVAQTLVREGDFAIRLAAELDLGNPENEATAEDMLAKAGVAPVNGWISDYPVTPEIIGQLGDSIASAAAQGALPMSSEEATKGLYSLADQMNLPVPAGPGSAGTAQAGQSSPTVINNYYYNEGPPIVTYYPPPADYLYLYDWVPYPVFWFGFWFPGFFICHNFTTTVFVTRTPFVTSRVFFGGTAIVSNRIINPITRTVAVVDPVVRTSAGGIRPMTALRTENGGMFRTLSDMRRGAAMTGVSAVRQGRSANSPRWTGGFKSPQARKGAAAIYSRSVQSMSGRRGPAGSSVRSERPVVPGARGRSYGPPATRGGGGYARPYVQRGAPARSSSGTVMRGNGGYARPYVQRSAPARSFSGPVMRGNGGYARPYVQRSAPARSFTGPVRGGYGSMPRSFGYGRHGRI